MGHRVVVGFVLGLCLVAPAARAQTTDFCTSLKAAWAAAKADPKSLYDRRLAGATLCTQLEGGLQCSWLLGTKENGRATFERFKAEAAACMAPEGLAATAADVAGSETSLLEGPEGSPAVAIIYPGNATVSVTIIVPD